MKLRILLDTGPLVALLDRKDTYHRWAAVQWGQVQPPLLTCEAVITEACYLLRNTPPGAQAVIELVERGIVDVAFHLHDHVQPVARLLAKYAKVPMSLADACLVRMAEVYSGSAVLTLDADFRLYRKHGRQVVPVIMPEVCTP
jgi:predicted nucleic acid-binding protein